MPFYKHDEQISKAAKTSLSVSNRAKFSRNCRYFACGSLKYQRELLLLKQFYMVASTTDIHISLDRKSLGL